MKKIVIPCVALAAVVAAGIQSAQSRRYGSARLSTACSGGCTDL